MSSSSRMGRKRIHIARITQDKRRRATFQKRRRGLIKKAMELSILCDCEVAVFVLSKDDTSVYTTNGNPTETVQRILSHSPSIYHNGHYEGMFDDDEASLDDFNDKTEEKLPEEPLGGSLIEKGTTPRSKRKRDQMTSAPSTSSNVSSGLHTSSTVPPHPALAIPNNQEHAFQTTAPPSLSNQPSMQQHQSSNNQFGQQTITNTQNDNTSALLQQMALLSQLLQVQQANNSSTVNQQTDTNNVIASLSSNLLGTIKNSLEAHPSTQSRTSSNGSQYNRDNSTLGSSPLIPVSSELSPSMASLSPQFPFSGLTPPSIPSSLTPPTLEGHVLDVNFSVSPTNREPSGPHFPITNTSSSLPQSDQNTQSISQFSSKRLQDNNKFGLRIAVPQPPRVFNIPPHLMSSTAPPTSGPIGGKNNGSNENEKDQNSEPEKTPSIIAPLSSIGPLSSMQPPANPFSGHQSHSHNDWPLQSPLISSTSNFMFSPFLYSPRVKPDYPI